MDDLAALHALIAKTRPPDAWPSLEKLQTLASIIVAQRPKIIVEIGVWHGDSLIPQLMALRHVGAGLAIAIDPWSAHASIEGETVPTNLEWWGRQGAHDQALATFEAHLLTHGLRSLCEIIRLRSDDVDLAQFCRRPIGLLHIDGNHTAQAVRDVERFASLIELGGTLVFDDLGWSGDHVKRAYNRSCELGFVELYPLGTGCVMQRRHYG
jgi:predicted O-methyltransferase YrrM